MVNTSGIPVEYQGWQRGRHGPGGKILAMGLTRMLLIPFSVGLVSTILVVSLLTFSGAMAQEADTEGFYDIEELERLIQIARESGFSQEEIAEITIEDNGKVINALEYLEAQKIKRRLADEKAREKAAKKYLTIQDILRELAKDTQGDIDQLRDESVFTD